MSEQSSTYDRIGLGLCAVGTGLMLFGAILAFNHTRTPIPITILQHPSMAPGRWEKAMVIQPVGPNSYVSAMFDQGLDFPSNKQIPRETVLTLITKAKQDGWIERDVKLWGGHYGVH